MNRAWLNSTTVLKDLSKSKKEYKVIQNRIEKIRTEIIKIHDYIMENYWNKLTTSEAYNLGIIGNELISKDFPGDFSIDTLELCYKMIIGIKKRAEARK